MARLLAWLRARSWQTVFAGLGVLVTVIGLVPVFVTWLGGGEFQVSAFSVNRVADVPADFVNAEDNQVIGSRQLPVPVIDVTVKNGGKETVVVTGAEFEIVALKRVERCDSGGGPEVVSAHYDVVLPDEPPTVPFRLTKEVRHTVRPGDVDRMTFSIGRRTIISYREPSWLFEVKVKLHTDSAGTVEAGTARIASPRIQPFFFGLETSPDDPQCPERNLRLLEEFVGGDGAVPDEVRADLGSMRTLGDAIKRTANATCAEGPRQQPADSVVWLRRLCGRYSPDEFVLTVHLGGAPNPQTFVDAGMRVEIHANGQLRWLISAVSSAGGGTPAFCLHRAETDPGTCSPAGDRFPLEVAAMSNQALTVTFLTPMPLLLAGDYDLHLALSINDNGPPGSYQRVPQSSGYLDVLLGHR